MWEANKNETTTLSLLGQIEYRNKLRDQLPGSPIRVVYSASGAYLAAAVVMDDAAVIDKALYWAAVESLDEARYLTAVLNSAELLRVIQPLQARGEHNPRHFDKYVWQAPIPYFDSSNSAHSQLVELAEEAENLASTVDLPAQSFESLRRRVRAELDANGLSAGIDALVEQILSPIAP